MATTDFSSSGGQITVTVESNDPINYSPSGSTYGFLPNFPNRLQVLFVSAGITVSYIVELADLRVSGSGSAPISEAAALTALNAVWAAAQGGEATFLEYVASITQIGTNNPTVVEASTNTLTGIIWERLNIGFYTGTLASVFTANKTFIWTTNSNADPGMDALFYRQDAEVIGVKTYNANTYADDILRECSIRIVVYP